jgi:hypothetical protein
VGDGLVESAAELLVVVFKNGVFILEALLGWNASNMAAHRERLPNRQLNCFYLVHLADHGPNTPPIPPQASAAQKLRSGQPG